MAYSNFDVNFTPTQPPVTQQEKRYGELQQGYSDAIAGQTPVPKLIETYDTKYNVPQLQGQIQQGNELYDYLGNQIRAIPKNIEQGSQESILTEGQKNRMVNAQQAPLLEQQGVLGTNLSRLGQNLSTAQSNASRMVEAEQVQQAKELQPWLQAFSNENVLSTMRMTGWTQENSMELQKLLANQQAGITLSEGEKNRMHELAVREKEFENQLKLNEQQFGFNKDMAMNYSDVFGLLGA